MARAARRNNPGRGNGCGRMTPRPVAPREALRRPGERAIPGWACIGAIGPHLDRGAAGRDGGRSGRDPLHPA
jgi:hypothetical protein